MFKISFDFDETLKQVSNVRVTEIQKKSVDLDYEIALEDNKLRLFPSAIEKLGINANDRISVQYISLGTGKSAPVIGKAEVFTDALDGNRFTAAGTVAFRGEKRATLAQFGTKFNLEAYKEGMWQLIPFEEKETDITQDKADLDDFDKLFDAEVTNLITDNNDDLPF